MGITAIALLGAPGAGKGTIAELISQATDYIHLSTGDILREAIKNGTEIGKTAEQYMSKGNLVPDKLIIELVMQRIDQGARDANYMFDGFPRTLAQARLLDNGFKIRGASLSKVFLLDVPKNVSFQRLTGRRICSKCGANFHVQNIPPRKNGICDCCGNPLEQRQDDMEETILNRLEIFEQQTAALIAYYKNKGILARIDSSGTRGETVAQIMPQLNSSVVSYAVKN
jgi:adenylate kinase